MKKLLTIVLASALVLTFVAPAMAMHFEMNGQLRVRSWYLDNYWPRATDGNQSGDFEFVDQRFRTTMKWGLTENVFLQARADVNEGFWGARIGVPSESVETDPVTGEINRVILPNTTTAKAAIAFDHVFMQFVWPGAPLTFIIGRQDVTWGNKLLAGADPRDRIKLVWKTGAVALGLAYDKNAESFQNELIGAGSDNRNYVAFAVTNVSAWKMGFLYAFNKDETTVGTPIAVGEGFGVAKDRNLHMFDVFANGMIGPVSIKSEFSYATGDDSTLPVKVDRSGFLAYVGGFMNAGMANLGLEFAYARGNDTDPTENTGAIKFDQHAAYNSIILFNGLDYPGYDALYMQNNGAGSTPGGNAPGADQNFANAISVKGTVTASPSEKLTLIGAVVYAKRDEVMAGVDKEMGWEFDAIGVYNIYDNLAWTLGVGYLSAGDFYRKADGSAAENPWGFMNRIEVKF
jgi:hypothetical protein